MALRHAVELYETYQCKISDCDEQIQQHLRSVESKVDAQTLPSQSSKRKRKPQRNEPRYDCRREMYRITGADLTRIDGIDAAAAQIIISEIGRDMSPWKTEKHFAAWSTLAPNHQISGGKILRRRPKRSANRFVIVLRMCAQSLLHSKSALGAYCRRICSRIGMPKGITATAHNLPGSFTVFSNTASPTSTSGNNNMNKNIANNSSRISAERQRTWDSLWSTDQL